MTIFIPCYLRIMLALSRSIKFNLLLPFFGKQRDLSEQHHSIIALHSRIALLSTEPRHEFLPSANNKVADQPAHLRSLISAFVVRCLDSILSLVSISEISSL